MPEDSMEMYQMQQAKEARELEDILNNLSAASQGTPRPQENMLNLESLGVSLPKAATQEAPAPAPVAVAEPEPAPTPQIDPLASTSPALAQFGLGGDLQSQLELANRRKADADRALGPAQQKAAKLEKALEENNAAMALLLKEVQELKNAKSAPAPAANAWYDPSLDSEFASMNPEVA